MVYTVKKRLAIHALREMFQGVGNVHCAMAARRIRETKPSVAISGLLLQ
jgi:hypothetical protein